MADMNAQLTFWSSSRSGFMSGAMELVVSNCTGRAVILDGSGQLVTHFEVASPPAKLISVVSAPKKVSVLAECVHRGGNALACLHEDGGIVLCDVRDGSPLLSNNTVLSGRTPQCATSIAKSDPSHLKGSYIVVGDTNCTLTVVNTDTLLAVHRTEVPPPGFTIGMVSFAEQLACVLPDKTLRYWAVKEAPTHTQHHLANTMSAQAAAAPSAAGGAEPAPSAGKSDALPGGTARNVATLEKSAVIALPGKGIPVGIQHHDSLPILLVISVTCCTVYRDAVQTTPIATIGITDSSAVDSEVTVVFSTGGFVPSDPSAAHAGQTIHIITISSAGCVQLYALSESICSEQLSSRRRSSFRLPAPTLVWESQCVANPLAWSMAYITVHPKFGEASQKPYKKLRVAGVGYTDMGKPVDSSMTPSTVRDNIAMRVAEQRLFVFDLGEADCREGGGDPLLEKSARTSINIRDCIEANQRTAPAELGDAGRTSSGMSASGTAPGGAPSQPPSSLAASGAGAPPPPDVSLNSHPDGASAAMLSGRLSPSRGLTKGDLEAYDDTSAVVICEGSSDFWSSEDEEEAGFDGRGALDGEGEEHAEVLYSAPGGEEEGGVKQQHHHHHHHSHRKHDAADGGPEGGGQEQTASVTFSYLHIPQWNPQSDASGGATGGPGGGGLAMTSGNLHQQGPAGAGVGSGRHGSPSPGARSAPNLRGASPAGGQFGASQSALFAPLSPTRGGGQQQQQHDDVEEGRASAACQEDPNMLTLFKGLCTGDILYEDATEGQSGKGSWRAHDTAITHILVVQGRLVTACAGGEIRTWRWGEWGCVHSTFLIHSIAPLAINVASRQLAERHGIEMWTIGAEGTIAFMDSASVVFSLCGNYHSAQDVNMEHSTMSAEGHVRLPESPATTVMSATSAAQLYGGVHYLKTVDYVVVVTANRLTAFVWHLGTETLLRTVRNEACTALAMSLFDSQNFVDTCVSGGTEAVTDAGLQDPAGGVCAYSDRTAFGAAVLRIRVSRLVESLYGSSANGSHVNVRMRAYYLRLTKMLLSYLLQGVSHPSVESLREALSLGDRPFPDGATLSFGSTRGAKVGTWMTSPSKGAAGVGSDDGAVASYLFSTSPLVTSQSLVTLLTLLHALCKTLEPHQAVLKAVINYFAAGIPQTLRFTPQYFEADFFWCLEAIKDPLRDVQFAARCVLNGILKQVDAEELHHLSRSLLEWRDPVAQLGLAVVAAQCNSLLQDTDTGKQAARGLITLATATGNVSTNLQNTALTHLGDSFALWASLLSATPTPTFPDLLKVLLLMSTSQDPYTGISQTTSRSAFRALINCGFHHLSLFLQFADGVLTEVQAPKDDDSLPSQNCILHALSQMMKKQAVLFIPNLLRVALLLLKALDPHFIRLRDKCMVTSTQALKTAVEMFPMMSFHQAKQSLAVGDVAGQAVVWDMKTGSKMFVWDAHHNPVTCMAFSTLGDQIATYCAREGALKIWSSEMPLLAILTSTHRPKLLATVDAPPFGANPNSSESLHTIKIMWISPHNVEITFPKGQSNVYEF